MSHHPLRVATGLAKGATASSALATEAVKRALQKANLETAQCVLLYFTSEFAQAPQPAIRAASKAANCTQVIGCSAMGIFTEEEWVLDGAAVAALVLSEDIFSSYPEHLSQSEYLLTLAAPSAINASWLSSPQPRFGGISGDATGHGAFSVWQDGKGVAQGYCALGVQGSDYAVSMSQGLRWLTNARRVTACNGFELETVANIPALQSLQTAFQPMHTENAALPLHIIKIAFAPSAKAFEQNQYQLASLILAHDKHQSITLSHAIPAGYWIRWAIRDTQAAQSDLQQSAQALMTKLSSSPAFACVFSCMGRGPYYDGGNDEDLKTLKAAWPQLPMIGFYGNGQIAPMMGHNAILQHAIVLALFGQLRKSHESI